MHFKIALTYSVPIHTRNNNRIKSYNHETPFNNYDKAK